MGDHHRKRVAPRRGQDLTISKSVYYRILKQNIENQVKGCPYYGKSEEKEN